MTDALGKKRKSRNVYGKDPFLDTEEYTGTVKPSFFHDLQFHTFEPHFTYVRKTKTSFDILQRQTNNKNHT